jgi:hypothetical protein
MTNVDTDYPEAPLEVAKAVYLDDRANKPISVKQAALDYQSWRLAHYRMKITWNRYGN